MDLMTIGQLASAAGVNVETVRYYQRRDLLAVPEREAGTIGRYSKAGSYSAEVHQACAVTGLLLGRR
jgi:MerR family regulatory protein